MQENNEKSTIRVSMPVKTLNEIEDILAETGLEIHEAVRLYLSQIVLNHGIPYNGFKSGLKPKPIKEKKRDQKREFMLEAAERELAISKTHKEIKHSGGQIPKL